MNFLLATKSSLLLLFMFHLFSCSTTETDYGISSPDKNISVHFWLANDKNACYRVAFNDTVIIQQSKLGIIRDDGDFSEDLSLKSVSGVETIKPTYELLRRKCSYAGNRRIFHLENSAGKKMDIIFRVLNDGVAFRYYFSDQSDETKRIVEETSSFHFLPAPRPGFNPWPMPKLGGVMSSLRMRNTTSRELK